MSYDQWCLEVLNLLCLEEIHLYRLLVQQAPREQQSHDVCHGLSIGHLNLAVAVTIDSLHLHNRGFSLMACQASFSL